MVCAAKQYPLVCVMSESFSIERRKLMRFLGAKVVLTNPAHKATGMMIKAQELAQKHDYFWTNQFENEANAWIHEQTTGPEIVKAFENLSSLNHFVTAYGTGGTLLGVSRYLKVHSPQTQIHVCEPSNAPMLYSGIESNYENDNPIPKEPHPVWRPHLFQGWAADFIPKLVQLAQNEISQLNILPISGNSAMIMCRKLAQKEGIFSGTSGGGIVQAALNLAQTCQPGTTILAMIPDTAERYLSTPLFADIPADMTVEEKELAASTPSMAPPAPGLPSKTPEAVAFVHEQIQKHKVLVWSLEYCEFCWTLTRFLDRLGVPYEQVNIDSFLYANDQMGNQYRAALVDETQCPTFPQLFVNGQFIGGAVDAAMMWKNNELQPLLNAAGLNQNNFNGYVGDPFEYLPKWMTANPLGDK